MTETKVKIIQSPHKRMLHVTIAKKWTYQEISSMARVMYETTKEIRK